TAIMKLILFIVLVLIRSIAICQESAYTQPMTLGIHFTFTDFETATAIRSSSLSSVLKGNSFGKLANMSQGLAISFGKGLSDHYDFAGTLMGSFLTYPIPGHAETGSEGLLWEADASIRGKMLPDKYWFVPYVQVGVGVSKYQGYWGTFIPAGVGIQINFFGEAYLLINSQYRIAVSESTNYHFVHTIGLVGNIGK
ncbi:MAG: hypothetical protein ABI415_10610, partial [Flavitalea sp.]